MTVISRRAVLTGALAAPVLAAAACSSTATTPSDSEFAALASSLKGRLLRGGDVDYLLAARPTAVRYMQTPAAVAFCTTANDVQNSLRFAREHAIPFAVRCGGHNYAGYSTTDGLLIDVRGLTDISYDAAKGLVTIGAGARNIDTTNALQPHQVMVPGGRCLSVGVSGLTLGGGWGFYARKYGLTCDKLVETTAVLADGSLVTCNAQNNADLFWAMRGGGGGNFGINTSFTFQPFSTLQPVSVFQLVWYNPEIAAVIGAFQDLAVSAPREFSAEIVTSPWQASSVKGQNPTVLTVVGQYLGQPAALRKVLKPLLNAQPPTGAEIRQMSFWEAHQYLTDSTPDDFFAVYSSYVESVIPAAGLDVIAEHANTWPGSSIPPDSNWGLFVVGGAVNDVPVDATAYPHRNASMMMKYETSWGHLDSPERIQAGQDWLNAFFKAMQPHVLPQSYVSFPNRDLPNWQSAYYGPNWDRLVSVKNKYDPDNVFSYGQSIPTH